MRTLLLTILLTPALASAQSAFDGTWKTKLDSVQFSGKPDKFTLIDGVYDCKNCAPPYKIKADGTDQPVPGHAYVDHEAMTVVSPTSVKAIEKKDGKVMFEQTLEVSADGSKLMGKFTSYIGDKPATGSFTEKRVGAAPKGAHAISGSWMQDSMSDMSDTARTVTLQSTPNGLKIMWNGQTIDGKFDGKKAPNVGDPGKTMVTLKKVSDTEVVETDRRQGKIVDIVTWSLAADGKTINLKDVDPVHGTKTTQVLEKQL